MTTKTQIAPRIRGKAFQEGKAWRWEILITFVPDREISDTEYEIVEPLTLTSPKDEPFISRDAALKDMKAHVPNLLGIMGDAMKVKITDYIDMKTGAVMPLAERT